MDRQIKIDFLFGRRGLSPLEILVPVLSEWLRLHLVIDAAQNIYIFQKRTGKNDLCWPPIPLWTLFQDKAPDQYRVDGMGAMWQILRHFFREELSVVPIKDVAYPVLKPLHLSYSDQTEGLLSVPYDSGSAYLRRVVSENTRAFMLVDAPLGQWLGQILSLNKYVPVLAELHKEGGFVVYRVSSPSALLVDALYKHVRNHT